MDIATPVLNERFEVLRTLSGDGQTQSHLALDLQTGQMAIVKELNLGHAFDWKSIELFERESKILQHLDHPSIPAYIDAFRIDDDTRLFLAQHHIEGENLESLLNQAEPFDEQQVRDLLAQMLDVLTYLHAFSPPVVHRDISPATILRDDQGRYHLIDFGAVQTIIQDQIGGSTIVGTSGYMPPEQLMGRAQPATDLYALAATCVALASGIHAVDLPVKLMKLQFRDHVSLSKPLCDILETMLEPDISERFTRPEQVQHALQNDRIELPVRAAQPPANLAPIHTINLDGLEDIKALIAKSPVEKQISNVSLEDNTLVINLPIITYMPFNLPVLWLFGVIATAFCMIAFGLANHQSGLCCAGFPLLFLGPLAVFAVSRIIPTRRCEQLTLSPHSIEYSRGKKEPGQQLSKTKVHFHVPMHCLRNCYMEAEFERSMSMRRSPDTPTITPPFRTTAIYFVDDNDHEHLFRTDGIARLGKTIGFSPSAYYEIEWLYEIVQTYLQIVTTQTSQDPAFLEAKPSEIASTN